MSLLRTVRSALNRRSRIAERTRSFADAARQAGALQQRMPRVETVDTHQIVGSVGRAHNLRGDFRPDRRQRFDGDEERFKRIHSAMQRGKPLPPVQLYRLGGEYYVLDGHHRVAAALSIGQLALDAHVVEFVPRGSVLTADR